MKDLISMVIVNYNGEKYIDRCIKSVLNQTYQEFEVIFIDNNSKDQSLNIVRKFENVKIICNKNNLGYSGGANQGIKLANGDYVVVMNPDIILENDFLQKCHNYINTDESIAVISGKLLKYDFDNDIKLNVIDSAGISATRARKFYDIGQNLKDNGEYENCRQVFAVCGAAPFYRKSILEKVKIFDEYYDEDFFAYKEDIDICWRFNLYGYKCIYVPKAIAYHGRGMNGANGVLKFINNRKTQSKFLRGLSFRNHYLMLIKNETDFSWKKDRVRIILRFIIFIVYSILFERFNLKYINEVRNLKLRMIEKKKIILENVNITMEKFYELFDS